MIKGQNTIGFQLSALGNESIKAIRVDNQQELEGEFISATSEEINLAVEKSVKAFDVYSKISGVKRAEFLEAIAGEIEALESKLIDRAMLESGLPQGRLEGERGRPCGQLRAFAALLREGSWVDAKIETAIPDRTPIPKPDLRKINTAIGPVVVFTASNFPLAFSTAGGDTASALASGCTVIVKAHESHLGTNSLVAGAIVSAAKKTNMPEGVFSSLNSKDYSVGTALVMHPSIKAVGFTGSIKGGKALYDLAQTRKEPIPVYAEMGSVNPVLLMPSKLKDNAKDLAATYSNSITMGVGQFCTNPGIIIGVQSDSLNEFAKELASNMAKVKGSCMLNKGISDNFDSNSTKILSIRTVICLSGHIYFCNGEAT